MPDTLNGKTNDSLIVGQTNHGLEIRGTILKITRHLAVFEIYNAANVLRLSEVLTDFRIIIQGRTLYSGRAVLSSLIDTGPAIVCEATLEDSWADIDFFSAEGSSSLRGASGEGTSLRSGTATSAWPPT